MHCHRNTHRNTEAMRTARAVNAAIHEVAAAVPKAEVLASADAPLPMLLRQPHGIATLMMASNAGISVTVGGIRQLPAMRAEAAAEIPGTQTIYPPDKDDLPNGGQPSAAAWEEYEEMGKLLSEADAARAIGDVERVEQAVHRLDEILQAADAAAGGEKGYPLRSSMLAYDRELKAIMRGKYDKT
jgi:hypothetical protein